MRKSVTLKRTEECQRCPGPIKNQRVAFVLAEQRTILERLRNSLAKHESLLNEVEQMYCEYTEGGSGMEEFIGEFAQEAIANDFAAYRALLQQYGAMCVVMAGRKPVRRSAVAVRVS